MDFEIKNNYSKRLDLNNNLDDDLNNSLNDKLNNKLNKVNNKIAGINVDKIANVEVTYFDISKPILSEPKVINIDLKSIINELKNNKVPGDVDIKFSGNFNFLSDDMMGLINLLIKYLKVMIKKFEASREMGNMLMTIQLNMADKMKDNLLEKANIMIGAAITNAGVSMAIHGIGAFTSIKGMGKDLVGHTNPMMVTGNLISSTADPLARVADQILQTKGIAIDGEQKVLEARGNVTSNVISNNNDIQREASEIIKAFLQAIETVIRTKQDAASSISNNLKA